MYMYNNGWMDGWMDGASTVESLFSSPFSTLCYCSVLAAGSLTLTYAGRQLVNYKQICCHLKRTFNGVPAYVEI